METTRAVSKSHPAIVAILRATFPAYKGRKVRVVITDRPVTIETSASGGTWDDAVALRADGVTASVPRLAPWDGSAAALANDGARVPAGMLLVIHSHFCGTDCGITIYCAPPTGRMLASGAVGLLPEVAVA